MIVNELYIQDVNIQSTDRCHVQLRPFYSQPRQPPCVRHFVTVSAYLPLSPIDSWQLRAFSLSIYMLQTGCTLDNMKAGQTIYRSIRQGLKSGCNIRLYVANRLQT